jgi:hypothetical protein
MPVKPQTNPVKFLLNQEDDKGKLDKQAVKAPAFSLTKVLSTAGLIVTPIAAYLVDQLGDLNLTEQHFVALAIGLFGFLAIAAAADVLARSIVTAAETKAGAERDAHFIAFQEPLKALQLTDGQRPSPVWVLGARDPKDPELLVTTNEQKNGSIVWRPKSRITSS